MKLRIIGMGNLLRRDDGVGVHAARALAQRAWPPDVEVMDVGTDGFALATFLQESEGVLLLDAVSCGKAPGAVVTFSPEDVRLRREGSALSLHAVNFWPLLQLAQALGGRPVVRLVGVQPADWGWGQELSPPVAAALPEVVRTVEREVAHWVSGRKPWERS